MVEGEADDVEVLRDSLEYTPTWVVATVCSIILIISLLVGRFLNYLGKLLRRRKQESLFEALQKLKEELMILGFISLLLIACQNLISHICIPERMTLHMLPCKLPGKEVHSHKSFSLGNTWTRRKLLSVGANSGYCKQGKVPLLSREALHHLHIFIFVLAVVHVIFCATTMLLAGAQIRKWKYWEESIRTNLRAPVKEDATPARQHLQFANEHAGGFSIKSMVVSCLMSFLKQFYASLTKSDYTALRLGFITTHCRGNPNFDFHNYMMKVLESDFKQVVGISWYLWLFVVTFMLLNIHGWHSFFWLSFLPLVLLLAVGAKLEYIIQQLAQKVAETVKEHGEPQVTPSDEHFWFNRPGIILYLIHFILFQNSFELAIFFWIWSTFGFNSCIMERVGYIISRLIIGVLIQVLCSYSTLPLYAIVTQMGSMFKRSMFEEHTHASLHGWAKGARKKIKDHHALLNVFGRKNKNNESSSDDQVQEMVAVSCEGQTVPSNMLHWTKSLHQQLVNAQIQDNQIDSLVDSIVKMPVLLLYLHSSIV